MIGPSWSSFTAKFVRISEPLLLITYVHVIACSYVNLGAVANVSASTPLVDFSNSTTGTGSKNPKSIVALVLSSSVLQQFSSLPAIGESSPVGSSSSVRLNAPDVKILLTKSSSAIFESVTLLSSIAFCVSDGEYPSGIVTWTL